MHLYERNWATSQNLSSTSYVLNQEQQELIPELIHAKTEKQNKA